MSGAKLVAGLGNPGGKYHATRHNLGFRVIEHLRRELAAGPEREECGSRVSEAPGVLLARPETYMNRSGWALRCLVDRHAVEPADLLVVYDEVALPLGRIRARGRGSAGGHRGMESILESLQTDEVPRLRLGVGPADGSAPAGDLAEFVLAPFDAAELAPAEELVVRAGEAVRLWLAEGLAPVMNRFNRPDPPAEPLPPG